MRYPDAFCLLFINFELIVGKSSIKQIWNSRHDRVQSNPLLDYISGDKQFNYGFMHLEAFY